MVQGMEGSRMGGIWHVLGKGPAGRSVSLQFLSGLGGMTAATEDTRFRLLDAPPDIVFCVEGTHHPNCEVSN